MIEIITIILVNYLNCEIKKLLIKNISNFIYNIRYSISH
jgi:hypothetical protein